LGSISLFTIVPRQPDASESTVFVFVGCAEVIIGVALLAFGVRRSLVSRHEQFSPVRAHTRVIGGLSVMSVLFVLSSIAQPYPQPGFTEFSVVLFALLALVSGTVAVLRMRHSALARSATAAHNVFWAFFFPFGTALWLWWLLSLRGREVGAA
jgi:hypothetical protein